MSITHSSRCLLGALPLFAYVLILLPHPTIESGAATSAAAFVAARTGDLIALKKAVMEGEAELDARESGTGQTLLMAASLAGCAPCSADRWGADEGG